MSHKCDQRDCPGYPCGSPHAGSSTCPYCPGGAHWEKQCHPGCDGDRAYPEFSGTGEAVLVVDFEKMWREEKAQNADLKAENEALKKERDEAIGKYHAEIHEGRKRCEGIVSIAEDASFRLGKAEGLENAVSILNGCEEAGRTARLEI